MTVLLVDDEIELRATLRSILESDGHDVVEAGDGEAGLKACREYTLDLIICDIDMPRMNGLEFFDNLHAGKHVREQIPFIFISGNLNDDLVISCLSAGAIHCLKKPFSSRILKAYVSSALSNIDNHRKPDPKELPDISSYHRVQKNCPYSDFILNFSKDNSLYLSFIRRFEKRVEDMIEITGNSIDDFLTWQIIFLIAEAHYLDKVLVISDLYHSVEAARSTVNNRINNLLENDVILKQKDASDNRRYSLSLSTTFNARLESFVRESFDNCASFGYAPETGH